MTAVVGMKVTMQKRHSDLDRMHEQSETHSRRQSVMDMIDTVATERGTSDFSPSSVPSFRACAS